MIYVGNEILSVKEGLDRLTNLSTHSHKIFKVKCDGQISNKCRNEYCIEYRNFLKYTSGNDGKLYCLYCSRKIKHSGRNNPNTKYIFDDSFFHTINDKEKAYLLGWIASDGHIGTRGFCISIQEGDKKCLEVLRDLICSDIPLKNKPTKPNLQQQVLLSVNSQQMSIDLCSILDIVPGKKSNIVNFPKIKPSLLPYFLRGYFEGDGHINKRGNKSLKRPSCSIYSNSTKMLYGIKKYLTTLNIKSNIYCGVLALNARESLEFLDIIYKDITNNLFLQRKYDTYLDWKKNYIYNSDINRRRGINHPHFGKTFSQETKEKMSIARAGENAANAKMNWVLIKEIRELYNSHQYSFRDLATKFRISKTAMEQIINNKTWVDKSYTYNKKDRIQPKTKKLNIEQIITIRNLLHSQSAYSIAKVFGVSKQTILSIKHNKIWKDIK